MFVQFGMNTGCDGLTNEAKSTYVRNLWMQLQAYPPTLATPNNGDAKSSTHDCLTPQAIEGWLMP